MQVKTTYKQIWKIAYPIILGSLAQNIINVTDTAFMGRVGEVELGGAAIGSLFYIVFFMIGFGLSNGMQIIISRRSGENKDGQIGKNLDNGIIILLGLALGSYFIIKFLTPSILSSILQSKEVFDASMQYLDYRVWSIFFTFIFVAFRAFYIGIADTKIIIWSSFLLAGVNVILDYCLIFGNWGFPEMGIGGAGLASGIAEAVTTIFILTYVLAHRFNFKFNPAYPFSCSIIN